MNDVYTYEFVYEKYFNESNPAVYVSKRIEAVNKTEAINSFLKLTRNFIVNRIVSIEKVDPQDCLNMNDIHAYEFVYQKYFDESNPAVYVYRRIEAVNEIEAINSFLNLTRNFIVHRIVSIKEIS